MPDAWQGMVEESLKEIKSAITNLTADVAVLKGEAAARRSRVKLIAWAVGVTIALPTSTEGVLAVIRATHGNPVTVTHVVKPIPVKPQSANRH